MTQPRRRPIPWTQIAISGGFWHPRIVQNLEVTLRRQWDMLKETGRIENFARAAARRTGGFQGRRYNDSDVYKWVEAASYASAHLVDQTLREPLDEVVGLIARAQQDDGYLNTWFQLEAPQDRWRNFGMMHELYCGGHLIEAALAHHEASGEDRLLDVALRFADHITQRFSAADSDALPGHQEIELALYALAERCGRDDCANLAAKFLDRRGRRPARFERELEDPDPIDDLSEYRTLFTTAGRYDGSYAQDHVPVTEQRDATGHAVRAMYQYCAMTDAAMRSHEPALEAALDALWESVTERRSYITGGVGSSRENEGFTRDYHLPAKEAYAETCAGIGFVLWAWRMGLHRGEAKYFDALERTLYNNVLGGVSSDGEKFNYWNPLTSDGEHQRQSWFDCACCPPNLSRLFQGLGRLVASTRGDDVYLHLFTSSIIQFRHPRAGSSALHVETGYPFSGRVELELQLERSAEFTLFVRHPAWCPRAQVRCDGKQIEAQPNEQGWIALRRQWTRGDTVQLEFEMPIVRARAHPEVTALRDRVALTRGPLVYCFEQCDHTTPPEQWSLHPDAELRAETSAQPFRGVVNLQATPPKTTGTPQALTAIPYYAWGNREPGPMRVWLSTGDGDRGK